MHAACNVAAPWLDVPKRFVVDWIRPFLARKGEKLSRLCVQDRGGMMAGGPRGGQRSWELTSLRAVSDTWSA